MKLEKYKIEFGLRFGINPFLHSNNELYKFIGGLSAFKDVNIYEDLNITDFGNTGYKELMSRGQSFIRIWRDKVEFGQYDDNFFHEIEQFKDYVDEGEIIFGSIPTQDFLEIVKEWRDFLIKCENDKEK
ncbi:hypothetical protein [Flavobacterium davisii]|uniref:hypothetical protein n=1 Tax=Flavobacterium davisii TaxID=2906077 RepID=UPI0035D08AF4